MLEQLSSPKPGTQNEVLTALQSFRRLLDSGRLLDTAETANALGQLYGQFDHRVDIGQGSHAVVTAEANTLNAIIRTVNVALEHELGKADYLVLDQTALPDSLRSLSERGHPEDHQRALVDDAALCVQIGAFRPAMVASWNLMFDVIRRWISSDAKRLEEFNALVADRVTKPKEVTGYEDFFKANLGERMVLEVCRQGRGALSGFNDKVFRALEPLLDQQNDYAHANLRSASREQTMGYIDQLVHIITEQPFSGVAPNRSQSPQNSSRVHNKRRTNRRR